MNYIEELSEKEEKFWSTIAMIHNGKNFTDDQFWAVQFIFFFDTLIKFILEEIE